MRMDLVKGTAVNTIETFHLFSLHFPPECIRQSILNFIMIYDLHKFRELSFSFFSRHRGKHWLWCSDFENSQLRMM